MKKTWSRCWKSSKQPRKQRKYRARAPLHIRRKLLSAMLDKKLRKQLGKKSLPIKKGDEVKVMRGEFKKTIGVVSRVDTKKLKVYIENVKRKKQSGQEVEVPIDPSNVMITGLNMDDRMRRKFLERKR